MTGHEAITVCLLICTLLFLSMRTALDPECLLLKTNQQPAWRCLEEGKIVLSFRLVFRLMSLLDQLPSSILRDATTILSVAASLFSLCLMGRG